MIRQYEFTVNTAGGAGAASGTGQAPQAPTGFLYAIKLVFHASAPATTDILIYENNLNMTILQLSDTNNAAIYFPRVAVCSTLGVALAAYDLIPIMDFVKASVSECDALTAAVTITLWVLE